METELESLNSAGLFLYISMYLSTYHAPKQGLENRSMHVTLFATHDNASCSLLGHLVALSRDLKDDCSESLYLVLTTSLFGQS